MQECAVWQNILYAPCIPVAQIHVHILTASLTFIKILTASQRQEQPVIVKYDNEFLEMDDKRQKPLRQYQLYTSED